MHQKNQHENYLPLLVKAFEQQNIDPSLMAAGITLTIRDLTANKLTGVYPVGSSVSRNLNEYQDMLDTVMYRNTAWSIGQAYEAFDTYLKNTITVYIHRNFGVIDQTILKDLIPGSKKSQGLSRLGLTQNDLSYWEKCIGYAHWNSVKILDQIRNKIAPKVIDIEQANLHIVNFVEWFDCLCEVRHAVTHSNGIIKPEKYKSNWTQQMLKEYFPGNQKDNGYDLKLKAEHVEKNLQSMAEYGFVIYKCLSKEQDYPIDIMAT